MAAWTQEQRSNAAVIYQVGLEVGASLRDIRVAIMAAIVESGLRSLDYGDRDSIGLFQQRDAWGSRAARLDPRQSARMFFLGGAAGQQGLLDIANRDSRSLGSLAQDVQVSAYPDRYAQHEAEAGALLASIDPAASSEAIPGTLGAVPGVSTPQPMGAEMPAEPSVLEINGLGEVTADESGIGSLTFGEPFIDGLSFDQAPAQAAAGRGRPAQVRHIQLPTLEELGVQPAAGTFAATYNPAEAPAGGTIFAGSLKGKHPYETTTVDGETVDYLTVAALQKAEEEFGAGFSIMQGGHSDYEASGGTHHGLGVVDVSVPNGDWAGAVAALRKIGFAAWVRNVPGYATAGSGAHIHAVLIGDEQLSPEAQTQVQSYLSDDNGLGGSSPDDGPRDFVNNRFQWDDVLDIDEHEQERGLVVKEAQSHLGVPFKWGGKDYQGLDDAGLVQRVYKAAGIDVPRFAFTLAYSADPEPLESAKLGDLIAWDHGKRLGIYAGDGMLVYAAGPGSAVQLGSISDMPDAWSIPVPKVARRMAYGPGATGGPYVPPPVTPTPAAPVYNTGGSQDTSPGSHDNSGQGGGSNHHDDNWHPTPDGDGYIG